MLKKIDWTGWLIERVASACARANKRKDWAQQQPQCHYQLLRWLKWGFCSVFASLITTGNHSCGLNLLQSGPELKSHNPVNCHFPTPELSLLLMCPKTMDEDCLILIKPQHRDVEEVVPGKDTADWTQALSGIWVSCRISRLSRGPFIPALVCDNCSHHVDTADEPQSAHSFPAWF